MAVLPLKGSDAPIVTILLLDDDGTGFYKKPIN
jgi:hypothetical protein